jgi:hypothetical protein
MTTRRSRELRVIDGERPEERPAQRLADLRVIGGVGVALVLLGVAAQTLVTGLATKTDAHAVAAAVVAAHEQRGAPARAELARAEADHEQRLRKAETDLAETRADLGWIKDVLWRLAMRQGLQVSPPASSAAGPRK